MSDNVQDHNSDVPDDLAGLGNEISPEQEKARKRQKRQIQKHNLKATFGAGPGRVAIIVFFAAILVLFSVAAYNFFTRKPPIGIVPTANAAGSVSPAPVGYGDTAAASEEEARMRREANNDRGAQVNKEGGVYIPGPVVTGDGRNEYKTGGSALAPASAAAASAPAAAPAAAAAAAAASAPAVQPALDPQYRDRLSKDNIMPQVLHAMGNTGTGATFVTGAYALPDRAPKAMPVSMQASLGQGSAAPVQQNGQPAPQPTAQQLAAAAGQKPLFDAGDARYCTLKYGVNSDAARRDVIGTCFNGPTETFWVIGRAEPSPDAAVDANFTVIFDKLSRPGKGVIPITAIAVDSDGESAMADDVNKHSFRKYGNLWVAGALKGIGQAASIITGTTSATTVGNVTTTTTTTDRIDARRTAEMAAGQVGIAMGDVFAREAQAIKPTVKLFRNKDLTVVFLAPVYDEKKF